MTTNDAKQMTAEGQMTMNDSAANDGEALCPSVLSVSPWFFFYRRARRVFSQRTAECFDSAQHAKKGVVGDGECFGSAKASVDEEGDQETKRLSDSETIKTA